MRERHDRNGAADAALPPHARLNHLLERANAGDRLAQDQLYEEIYDFLRARAERLLYRNGGTLRPTDLLHDAYVRISHRQWADELHLIATLCKAMHHALVDHLRRKSRAGTRIPFDHVVMVFEERAIDLVALQLYLEALDERDATMARAMRLRFFAAIDVATIAEQLGMAKRTLEARLQLEKARFFRELGLA